MKFSRQLIIRLRHTSPWSPFLNHSEEAFEEAGSGYCRNSTVSFTCLSL